MKQLFLFSVLVPILVGCSSSASKTNPLIESYMIEHIANPDTYKAGVTDVIEQGSINVENTINWHDIPLEGNVDVVVLRHMYTSVDISGDTTEKAFIFYMNPAQDVIYYAHKDKGIPLFTLE